MTPEKYLNLFYGWLKSMEKSGFLEDFKINTEAGAIKVCLEIMEKRFKELENEKTRTINSDDIHF